MKAQRHKIDYRLLNISNLNNPRFVDKDDENIQRYFHDIRNYKVLNQDEEQNIIKRIKSGDKDADLLKTKLVCSHQPFVITFAKRHCPRDSDQLLDLIQEGNYGMMMALENFNIKANVKFITYANAWIVKYMYKFLENNDLIQRNNRSKTFGVDVKVREKFIKDYGYEPTSQELFEIFNEMGMGIKHKEDLVNVTVVSMDTPPVAKPNGIDDDDEVTIEYGEDNTIMEDLDKDMNITKIRAIMKYLDDNETKVIRSKFGFDNGVEKDELGVAHDLGITVYTATKLLESAFNKLKKYKFLFE
jgi:RNA polymerase primary sigma factor